MTAEPQPLPTDALAPCPFCGGAAAVSHSYDGEVCNVRCLKWGKGCLGAGSNEYTEEKARAAWNRRAPAPVGVEPAQWQKRHQLRTNGEWENTNEHDAKWWRDNSKGWEIRALYTTPQPTQAQAGAVPLTCEWTHNEDDGFWDTECGQSWQFDDGGPKENNMHFCHHCGKPMHIKGGQHAD